MTRRGAHEGSVYQRADGKWVGALHVGYRDGRRVRRVVYGRTRREANHRLAEVRRQADAGVDVAAKRQTVGRFLDTWLEEVVRPSTRTKTYVTYASIVRVHLIPGVGRVWLDRLGPADIQAMLNAKAKAGRAPRTVRSIRAVLRDALGCAQRWGLVSRNAAALTEAPRVRQQEPTVLTPTQAREFVDAVRNDRLGARTRSCLGSGSDKVRRWHFDGRMLTSTRRPFASTRP